MTHAVYFHLCLLFLLNSSLLKAQCINSYPHVENFESAPVWTSGGVNSDWTWGTPSKSVISSAGGGTKSWCVGGLTASFYNYAEQASIVSPCYDFSSLTYPHVVFKVFWESEYKYDGGNLQYSINGGTTWTNVGAYGNPVDCMNTNWFNYSSINYLNTPAWVSPNEGWCGNMQTTSGNCQGGNGSGGWVVAQHCLNGLAGQSNVKFRFTFGAGTACNSYDGFAIDDFMVENGTPNAPDFTYACAGINTLLFTSINPTCPTPSTYQWNFGDLASGSANTSTLANPNHIFSSPGIYNITLTTSGGPCNPPGSIAKTVTIMGANIASQNSVSCFGGNDGNTVVNVTNGVTPLTYSWLPSGGNNPIATGLSAGTYTVTITDANSCIFTLPVIIGQPVALTASITATAINCNSGTGSAIAIGNGGSAPYSFLWSDGQTTQSATGLAQGTYSLTITDNNSCTQTSAITITQAATFSVLIAGTNPGCHGGIGSAIATGNGGSSPYSFFWSDGQTTQNATGFMQGTYSVTVIDNNGCTQTSSVSITQPTLLSVSGIGTNPNCNGGTGSIITNINGGTSPYSYSWSNGQTTQNISGLAPGSYTIVVSDNNGCVQTNSVSITQPTALLLTTNATQTSCTANSGTTSVNVIGGTGGYSYIWNPSGQTSQTATALAAGIYSVTVTDTNSCTATQSAVVISSNTLTLNTSSTQTGCIFNNGTATVNSSNGTPPYTYSWNNGQTTHIATGLMIGTYTVIVTDANNCILTQTVNVSQISGPLATAAVTSASISSGESTTLLAGGGGTYEWSPTLGGLNCINCANPVVTPLVTTVYCVLVTDNNSCTDNACITVDVELDCSASAVGELFIPNAFSPNQDGENDTLKFFYGNINCISKFYFIVFDRWGEKVFETKNPKFSWDGEYRRIINNTAVFIYYLKATLLNGERIEKRGNITLIK